MVCWTLHYAKRILETLFVHRFSHNTMPITNLFKVCGCVQGGGICVDMCRKGYVCGRVCVQSAGSRKLCGRVQGGVCVWAYVCVQSAGRRIVCGHV